MQLFSFVKEMRFNFNVKGSTTRGKLLKTLYTDPGLQHSDPCRIDANDCCIKCNETVKSISKFVRCAVCEEKFHNTCLTHPLPDDFITYQSTSPCLWWICLECAGTIYNKNPEDESAGNDGDSVSPAQVQDFKQVLAEQLSSLKVDLMKDVIETIDNKLSAAIDNSQSSVNTLPRTSDIFDQSYASITGTNLPPSSPSPQTRKHSQNEAVSHDVLLLSPINPDTDITAADIDKVKKSVGGKLKKLQVEFVRSNPKNKTIAVGFKNKQLRDEGNETICADDHLSSIGFKSKLANKMLPKLTISGIPLSILDTLDSSIVDRDQKREAEKEIILRKITEKNPGVSDLVNLEHTLAVVFVGRVKRFEKESLTIGLKVSPSIRATILNQQSGRLYLDYSSYWASDRYYVKQCYHCQLLGHTSEDCPSKESKPSVCMYCLESHRSKDCPSKRKTELHKCARCKSSPLSNESNNFADHHAGSTTCPMIVREARRLASMTDLTSKNVM